MNDQDFMRYSRHLLLEEVGLDGQQALSKSCVAVIGLGGLGSPAAHYLAGAGVGQLILADGDVVHISNLHRQTLYTQQDIGRLKAHVAVEKLAQVNPSVTLTPIDQYLTSETLNSVLADTDLVLDCSDNMQTRQAINAACVALNKPFITASAVGFGGQMMVLSPPWQQGCYRCLWPDEHEPERNCRTAGVLGPVVGLLGVSQALEALKWLAGVTHQAGTLSLFDAKTNLWRAIRLQPSPHCPVCGGQHANSV